MVAPNTTVSAPSPDPAEQGSLFPDAASVESFNSQLQVAKLEALAVLQNLLYLDSDKDLAIHTQRRLAATAILRVKELRLPEPPRQPRNGKRLSALSPVADGRNVAAPSDREGVSSGTAGAPKRSKSTLPRSLNSLDTPALIALAEQAFAPDSTISSRDKIRIAMRVVSQETRRARAEMKAQRAQARAMLRRPDS